MADGTTSDMTDGLYRRIYAGFITGRRINAVSIGAEMCFWRLQAVADDFGNLPGDTAILCSLAFPLRRVSTPKVEGWITELATAQNTRGEALINRYHVHDESYIHIDGFERRQPARKNGRKVQRFPVPGESGGIRGNPGVESSRNSPKTQDKTQDPRPKRNTHSNTKTQEQGRLGSGVSTKPTGRGVPGWKGRHISVTDLRSNEKLVGELWPMFAVDGGTVAMTPENRQTFVALAEYSIRKADPPNKAGALFADNLKHWSTRGTRPSNADDAAAATRIREWQEQVGHD